MRAIHVSSTAKLSGRNGMERKPIAGWCEAETCTLPEKERWPYAVRIGRGGETDKQFRLDFGGKEKKSSPVNNSSSC